MTCTQWFTKASISGDFQMGINLAGLISLAVVFSGSFALSSQSVEARTTRNSSHAVGNYFVPAPPPYTPSMVPTALGMTYAQALTVDADGAVVRKLVDPYSKYMFTHNQGDLPQVARPNPYVTANPSIEARILKRIDSFDSEISSTEKEIGKLLDL
jgi:hypothetical protein